ncbi:MAG: hypothetical protein KDA44_06360 [Planctomycetales bacterium]|nr:hypothetical protein [Planctomycetales bacterium]
MPQIDPQRDLRILVVGNSAAGKSTLARALADRLAIPHVELDALYWQPQWQTTAIDEFRRQVAAAAAGDAWIADGNYMVVRDQLWPRATTVVWLNYSLPTVLARGVRRTLRRVVSREELFSRNRESIASLFGWNGIPLWIVRMHRRRRRELAATLQQPACQRLRVYELTTRKHCDELLRLTPVGQHGAPRSTRS